VADDESAIAHAQRLATKVQHQERELATQRERIHELEAQVRWYRQLVASLGVDPQEEETVASEETGVSQGEKPPPSDTPKNGTADTPGVTDWLRRWLS
jgi:hypothetical protein